MIPPITHPIHIAFSDDDESNSLSLIIPDKSEFEIVNAQFASKHGSLYIPACPDLPPDGIMDRFLAKTALEAFALRMLNSASFVSDMINDNQIDVIRNFARFGEGPSQWPYSQRVIYDRKVDQGGRPSSNTP